MEELSMDDFYELEYRKVPFIFKFNRSKSKVFYIIFIVLVVIMGIILAILPHTEKVNDSGLHIAGSEYTFKYVTYSSTLWTALVIVGILAVLISLWFFIGILYDKKIYKDASLKYQYYKQECQRRDYEKLKEHRRNQESSYTYK